MKLFHQKSYVNWRNDAVTKTKTVHAIRNYLKTDMHYKEAEIDSIFEGLHASPALHRIFCSSLFLDLLTNNPSYFIDFITNKFLFEQEAESYIVSYMMYNHIIKAIITGISPDLDWSDYILKDSHRYLIIAMQRFAWHLRSSNQNYGKLKDVDLLTYIKGHGVSLQALNQPSVENELANSEMTKRLHEQMLKIDLLTSPSCHWHSEITFSSPWFFYIFVGAYCVDNADGEQWLNNLSLAELAGQQHIMTLYVESLVKRYFVAVELQERQKIEERITFFFSRLINLFKTNSQSQINGGSPLSDFEPKNVDDFYKFHLVFLTCWDITISLHDFVKGENLAVSWHILHSALSFAVESTNPLVIDQVINLQSIYTDSRTTNHLVKMLENSTSQLPTLAFLAERKRGLRPLMENIYSPLYTVLLRIIKTTQQDGKYVRAIKKITVDCLLQLINSDKMSKAKEFFASELVQLTNLNRQDLEPYLKESRVRNSLSYKLINLFGEPKNEEMQTLIKR